MPQYRLTHAREITPESKQQIATSITDLHCNNTGAPSKYVQVLFVRLEDQSGYTGAEHNADFINLDCTIRPGRSEEAEQALLWDLDLLIKKTFSPAKYYITISRYNTALLIENGELLPQA